MYPQVQHCVGWIWRIFSSLFCAFQFIATINFSLQIVTFSNNFTVFTDAEGNMTFTLHHLHFHDQVGELLKIISYIKREQLHVSVSVYNVFSKYP